MSDARAGEPPPALSPLATGDCAALASLHAALFPPGWDEAALRSLIAGEGAFGFGFRNPRLSGFVLCRVAADEAEVLTLGVASAQRRRGVGRGLLKLAMAAAARRGAAQMFVEVGEDNPPARGLYGRLGFVGVGRREQYYLGTASGAGTGGAALVLRCELCDLKSQAACGAHPRADERSR